VPGAKILELHLRERKITWFTCKQGSPSTTSEPSSTEHPPRT